MTDPGEQSSAQNGTAPDPLERLSSFRTPRDLSLGGVKPNKKIFTPNLNVTRNKNKGTTVCTPRDQKRDNKLRHDRRSDKNKNLRHEPNIIKSSGVFSEGMGAAERRHADRVSYGRDALSTSTSALEKPALRAKEGWKIDKDIENKKIKTVFGEDGTSTDDVEDDPNTSNGPVRLPLIESGSTYYNKKKPAVQEVKVKREPDENGATPSIDEKKSIPDVKKETFEDTDIISMLECDKQTHILLRLPDSLPGRGAQLDPPPQRTTNKHNTDTDQEQQSSPKPVDDRCRLKDLEEGKIGRILVYSSGKVRVALGDTMFEVYTGTKASFRHESVSVACDDSSRSANIVALGQLHHKLILVPDWEAMFKDVK